MTPQTIEDVLTKEIQGTEVPALGLGTWMLEGRACREAVRDALEIGYRHLDTAQAYGNEEEVGRGLADSGVARDEVWLTTKLWLENLGHGRAIESARGSLRRLGTDYVDLLLIHWPPTSELPSAGEPRGLRLRALPGRDGGDPRPGPGPAHRRPRVRAAVGEPVAPAAGPPTARWARRSGCRTRSSSRRSCGRSRAPGGT